MYPKIKKLLPWLALAAAVFSALLLIASSTGRSQMLAESPETSAAAQAVIDQIRSLQPAAVDDPALFSAVRQAAEARYIAQAWLFAPDGTVVLTQGTPVDKGKAGQNATREVRGALDALPEGSLTAEQRTLLLVSSAIQAEGEHNDVFRYKVTELRSQNGEITAYLGLAYDVNPSISAAPGAGQVASILGLLFCLAVYWLSLPAWTYLDARQRGERAGVWTLFVLIGNLVALIAYLLTRERQ